MASLKAKITTFLKVLNTIWKHLYFYASIPKLNVFLRLWFNTIETYFGFFFVTHEVCKSSYSYTKSILIWSKIGIPSVYVKRLIMLIFPQNFQCEDGGSWSKCYLLFTMIRSNHFCWLTIANNTTSWEVWIFFSPAFRSHPAFANLKLSPSHLATFRQS